MSGDIVNRLKSLDDATGYLVPEVSAAIEEIERLRKERGDLLAAAYTMMQFARDLGLAGCTTAFGVFMRRERAVEKVAEIIKACTAKAQEAEVSPKERDQIAPVP